HRLRRGHGVDGGAKEHVDVLGGHGVRARDVAKGPGGGDAADDHHVSAQGWRNALGDALQQGGGIQLQMATHGRTSLAYCNAWSRRPMSSRDRNTSQGCAHRAWPTSALPSKRVPARTSVSTTGAGASTFGSGSRPSSSSRMTSASKVLSLRGMLATRSRRGVPIRSSAGTLAWATGAPDRENGFHCLAPWGPSS